MSNQISLLPSISGFDGSREGSDLDALRILPVINQTLSFASENSWLAIAEVAHSARLNNNWDSTSRFSLGRNLSHEDLLELFVSLYNRVEDLNDSWKAEDKPTVDTVKKLCDYNNDKHPGHQYYERTDIVLLEMVTLDRLIWAHNNRDKDISDIEIPRHSATLSNDLTVGNSYLRAYFKLGQLDWKETVLNFVASYNEKDSSIIIPQERAKENCSVSQLIRRSLSKAEMKVSENAVRANLLYAGLAIRALLLVSDLCKYV